MIETRTLLELINGQLFGVWFLMGAALVFWMQAGFADVANITSRRPSRPLAVVIALSMLSRLRNK